MNYKLYFDFVLFELLYIKILDLLKKQRYLSKQINLYEEVQRNPLFIFLSEYYITESLHVFWQDAGFLRFCKLHLNIADDILKEGIVNAYLLTLFAEPILDEFLNQQRIQKRCFQIKRELMEFVWNPDRLEKYLSICDLDTIF